MMVSDVAKELGISEKRVREYCRAGRLGEKLGRQWIITEENFEQFMLSYDSRPGRRPKGEEE